MGRKNIALLPGPIIPNVFGTFGNPYNNSVIETFSPQLTYNEEPKIEIDAQLKLIYIGELVKIIYDLIKNKTADTEFRVPHTKEIKVTEILALLKDFKSNYNDKGTFPDLDNPFKCNLFNTFVCYMDIENHFPAKLKQSIDERGTFVETVKLNCGGQVSFSTTKQGITRGQPFPYKKSRTICGYKRKSSDTVQKNWH